MKRPFELVAEIQEKDAEIERLRDTIAKMENAFVMRANAERELLEEALESYKSLLTRAADALEPEQNPVDPPDYAYLIAELRKAAE